MYLEYHWEHVWTKKRALKILKQRYMHEGNSTNSEKQRVHISFSYLLVYLKQRQFQHPHIMEWENELYYSNTFQCYKIHGFWGTFVFLFKTWLQIIGRFIRWSTEALPSSRDMVQWQGTRIGRSNQKLKDFHFHLEPCSAVFRFYFLFCCDKTCACLL